jgi:hypothetical protein
VQAVAVGFGAQRVERPLGSAERHGVEVAGQAQRRHVQVGAPLGDEGRPTPAEAHDVEREPGVLQFRGEQGDRVVLRPPGGVERDEFPCQAKDIGHALILRHRLAKNQWRS